MKYGHICFFLPLHKRKYRFDKNKLIPEILISEITCSENCSKRTQFKQKVSIYCSSKCYIFNYCYLSYGVILCQELLLHISNAFFQPLIHSGPFKQKPFFN